MLDYHVPPDIGLMGRASTGKDTAGAYLADAWGHKVLSFAEPLRELAAFLDPIVQPARFYQFGANPQMLAYLRYSQALDVFGYRRAKDNFPEFRDTLDKLGRGVREVIGADAWVDVLASRVERLAPRTPFTVTDVRFPNEVDYLRSKGAVLIRLTRSSAPIVDAPSETAADHIEADYTFANEGDTPEALYEFLDDVVTRHARALV